MKKNSYLLVVIFLFLAFLPISSTAQEKGYWKFSHIVSKDKELKSPASNKLFLRTGHVSDDKFKDNGAGSLLLNCEAKQLKDGKASVFRGRLSCSGLPAKLVPGNKYTTTIRSEHVESISSGPSIAEGAMIGLYHSDAKKTIDPEKTPFFRLGEVNLSGKGKPVSSAEKNITFKVAGRSEGEDEYALRLMMYSSNIQAYRTFIYRWHGDDEKEPFKCPHCGKEIDASLLPK